MNALEEIEIANYQEDYEKLIIQFEQESAIEIGEGFPLSRISTATVFHQRYSSRTNAFAWSQILIALNKNTHEVVGTVHGTVRTVYQNDTQIKILHVFGLKIHPDFDKHGLSTKLIVHMEDIAKSIGIDMVFVKIPDRSLRTNKLFVNKLGFKEVGSASMAVVKSPCFNTSVVKISAERAREMTDQFYKGKDLALVDFLEIFNSPAYIGTYLLEVDKEYIGASLWNISYYSEVEINKVLVNVSYIRHRYWFPLIVLALILTIIACFAIWYGIYEYFEDNYAKVIVFTVGLYLFFWIIKAYWVIINYLIQARTIYKPRVKVFGVFYSNSLETKVDLFNLLLQHLPCASSCEYCIFEFHQDDICSDIVKNEDYCKRYLQKNLDGTPVSKWNKNMFVDPRD